MVYAEIHALIHADTSIKLQHTHAGPYLVTALPSRHKVALMRLDTGQELAKPIAIEFLKPLDKEMSAEFLKGVICPEKLEGMLRDFRDRKAAEEKILTVWG